MQFQWFGTKQPGLFFCPQKVTTSCLLIKRLMTWRHFNEQNYILSNPFSLPKGPRTEFDTAVRLVEVTFAVTWHIPHSL